MIQSVLAVKLQMKLNVSKCKMIHVSGGKNLTVAKMHSDELCLTCLGIMVCKNVALSSTVNEKAN